MKKRTLALTLTLVTIMLLAGCSLVATKDTNAKPADSGNATFDPIAITENYSFTDPADLDFDARYVVYCDTNSVALSTLPAEYGVQAMYSILYAKEDAPKGDYELFVCDTAEHAETVAQAYAAQGMTLTATEEDPTVLYVFSDGDTMEATIITLESYGVVSDSKVSTYAEFMKTTYGGTLLD